MVMGAVGMDGLLLDGGAEGLGLAAVTDLLSLKTTTEQVNGLESSTANISRLRVGLEATRPFPLPNGAALLPSVEVGIRHDGGDAETGFGLEVGAALAWNDPQQGISAEVKGRSLVTHVEEEFRQQGLALSFTWEPDPTNRGPSLAIGHTMGAPPASGMDALLDPTVLEGLDSATSNGQQFKAQLTYGFPTHNDGLTMTPGLSLALSPSTSTYSLLWSLAPYSQPGHGEPWEIAWRGNGRKVTPQHPLWIIPSRSASLSPSDERPWDAGVSAPGVPISGGAATRSGGRRVPIPVGRFRRIDGRDRWSLSQANRLLLAHHRQSRPTSPHPSSGVPPHHPGPRPGQHHRTSWPGPKQPMPA